MSAEKLCSATNVWDDFFCKNVECQPNVLVERMTRVLGVLEKFKSVPGAWLL